MPLEPIRIGTTFERQYTFETSPGVPRDLTGVTVTFNIQNGRTLHSFTTASGVTVTPLTGVVDILLTPAQTAAFAENNGAESYIQFTTGGVIEIKAPEIERIITKDAPE